MSQEDSAEIKPEVKKLADLVGYQENSVVSRTLVKREKGTVTLFAFEKGSALSEHTAPFDALVYLVDGEAEVVIDSKSYRLETGDTILLPANRPHAVKATSRLKMLLTMIRS
ncbi:MAG: cupin domain-containing protein [Candidatus Latescibacterota bacterium]|nr:MAG: cupin domain-containing protein [Candidatus Latescibacterota bacterium]